MEPCEVCGRTSNRQWGMDRTPLCEEHFAEAERRYDAAAGERLPPMSREERARGRRDLRGLLDSAPDEKVLPRWYGEMRHPVLLWRKYREVAAVDRGQHPGWRIHLLIARLWLVKERMEGRVRP